MPVADYYTMKHILLLFPLAAVLLLAGCTGTGSEASDAADSVKVKSVTLSDTSSFAKRDGQMCRIIADARFDIPTAVGDSTDVTRLLTLYATHILHAPDSIAFDNALQASVANSMHQFDNVIEPDDIAQEEEENNEPIFRYATTTNVSLVYNRHGIATFCRVDTIRKNEHITWVAHRYYNFDLGRMERVTLHDLIADDNIADLTQLLQRQLLAQNNAANNEQLNTLGYFNADNITPTANFYFTPKGIAWSYLPGELAIDAVGEPVVALQLDALAPLAGENSLINRLR